MTPVNPSLPIISLHKLVHGPGREEEIARLRQVTHEIGFFYLADHGVPLSFQREMIDVAKEFFALPKEQKYEISNLDNPHYRGYAELGDERTQGLVDWREQIDYGADLPPATEGLDTHPWRILQGPNPWPGAVPRMKDLVTRWQEDLGEVGMTLLRAWAESLGQEPEFFDAAFADSYPTMKLAHYPGHDGSESGQGVGAHHDSGVLTLLLLEDGSSGLQVQTAGGWIDADPITDHFVVNIGELLEAATDGYLKGHPAPRPAARAGHLPLLGAVFPGPGPGRPLPPSHPATGAGRGRPRHRSGPVRPGDLRPVRTQHHQVPFPRPPRDHRPLPRGARGLAGLTPDGGFRWLPRKDSNLESWYQKPECCQLHHGEKHSNCARSEYLTLGWGLNNATG